MGEPLFDVISAVIVATGAVAIILLRSAEAATSAHSRQLSLVGHLLLGISVSLLLYRWIDGVLSLPTESRPNLWQSGALMVACGIGLVAAVKSVVGPTVFGRVKYLLMAVGCVESMLLVAAEWQWALLLQVLFVVGVAAAKWLSPRTGCEPIVDEDSPPREPALVLFAGAALLLVLLGTWQHVAEYEAQRTTRSPRYSAWPRASALKNAWERTGWTAKSGSAESSTRTTDATSREQRVALGLGALWFVVVAAAWCQRKSKSTVLEADDAD